MIRAVAKLIWLRTCSVTLRMVEGQCRAKEDVCEMSSN